MLPTADGQGPSPWSSGQWTLPTVSPDAQPFTTPVPSSILPSQISQIPNVNLKDFYYKSIPISSYKSSPLPPLKTWNLWPGDCATFSCSHCLGAA